MLSLGSTGVIGLKLNSSHCADVKTARKTPTTARRGLTFRLLLCMWMVVANMAVLGMNLCSEMKRILKRGPWNEAHCIWEEKTVISMTTAISNHHQFFIEKALHVNYKIFCCFYLLPKKHLNNYIIFIKWLLAGNFWDWETLALKRSIACGILRTGWWDLKHWLSRSFKLINQDQKLKLTLQHLESSSWHCCCVCF